MVCECAAVRALAYLLPGRAQEVYKEFTTNQMSNDTRAYHETWPVVLHAPVKRFMTKLVRQKAHNLETQAFHRTDKGKL